ncbi:hypothetical protein GCM10022233_87490 [Streptomyces shaanxiensis]|uniref:Uncharacterized protein n=1 Tax=Streptomyces shaanxiensis TaxID=653357 RepID=A0ABP7WK14_9ACTN
MIRDEHGREAEGEVFEQLWDVWSRKIQAQWEVLDNDLRPRALEVGTEWVPALWSRHVREYLARLTDETRYPNAREHLEGMGQLAVVVQRVNELYT